MCDFALEAQHNGIVIGVDEVGRGPLAGPVIAASVYIPPDIRNMDFIADIKDSKKLGFKKLEALYDDITGHCAYGIASITPEEIDEINILQAALKAMRLSVEQNKGANFALIDGNKIPRGLPCPAEAIVKGDSKSKSIAAASIIAKVTRDRIMHELAREFPHYGWESNVGYPAPQHLKGIQQFGITEHHRKSFRPVRDYLEAADRAA